MLISIFLKPQIQRENLPVRINPGNQRLNIKWLSTIENQRQEGVNAADRFQAGKAAPRRRKRNQDGFKISYFHFI